MEDELKKFLTKSRDPISRLAKYDLISLFKNGLNKELNIIILRLLENKTIDNKEIIEAVIKNIKYTEDIVTLAICLKNGCSVTDELVQYIKTLDKDLSEKILILIDINNGLQDKYEATEYIFLCCIMLNINTMVVDLIYDDYFNIISSYSSLYKIKSGDGGLLKQCYRSYNYKRFVEMIEDKIFPDYIMINDIILSINMSRGIPRLELINMLQYLIYKNIKLDVYQVDFLLNRKKVDTFQKNNLLMDHDKRHIQQFYNNDDIIFSIIEIIDEKIVIKDDIINKILSINFIIINEDIMKLIILKAKEIISLLTEKDLDKIKIPLYRCKDTILLSEKHSLMTFCRNIINHYKNGEKKKIVKIINDIK